MRIDPVTRYFWEGAWPGGQLEMRRLLYDCELVYVSRGAADLEVAGQRHRIKAGDVAIIPPATVHQSYVPIGGEVVRHCVHFDWTTSGGKPEAPLFTWHGERFHSGMVHAVPAEIASHLPLVMSIADQRELVDALEFALRLLRRKHPLGPRQLGVVLAWILDPPALPDSVSGPAHTMRERMAAVLRHIDACYAEDLTHRDLCRIGKLGSTSLCRMFQSIVGTRPLAYVQQVRVRHAQRLLGELRHPVQDIAGMVGFTDPNYFSRVFRRETGQSPVEFRQRALELQQEQHHLVVLQAKRREQAPAKESSP